MILKSAMRSSSESSAFCYFFAGLIGLVLFEKFLGRARDADRNTTRSAFHESQNF
jgi:hypothetical protein